MSEPNDPRVIAVRHRAAFAAAVAMTALAATGAWSQSATPSPPRKSVIIPVAPTPTPTPAPVAAPAAAVPADPPKPEVVAPAPAEAVAPRENPGLINELGKMLTVPTWTLPSMPSLPSLPALPSLKLPSDGGVAVPGMTTMVKGRAVCPLSPNGAPDCKAASDKLCQSKGFKEGKSIDTDSARTCSPRALLSGRKPEESECKTENFVTQALCQ